MARRITGYGRGAAAIDLAPVPDSNKGVPTSSTAYDFGQLVFDQSSMSWYIYSGGSSFIVIGGGSSEVSTLSDTSSTIVSPSAGNIQLAGTSGQVSVTAGVNELTFALPSSVTAPGSISAATSLTASLGNITATNGNLVLGTAGNKLSIATGSNSSIGVSGALSSGSVTVSTSAVTSSSKIFLSRAVAGGTLGELSVGVITAGTSFTITCSSSSDTSTINYLIIN